MDIMFRKVPSEKLRACYSLGDKLDGRVDDLDISLLITCVS
jgi:hypothetical protein